MMLLGEGSMNGGKTPSLEMVSHISVKTIKKIIG